MDFYVYIHRRKTTGEVFYVGKGKGNRAWSKKGRNSHWNKVAKKCGFTVEIYRNNLQEWYAFELEKDLIAYYGRVQDRKGPLVNYTDGGEGPSGVDCAKTDSSIYNFYNFKTGQTFTGLRINFKRHFGIDPAPLFYKTSNRVDINISGWILYDKEIPTEVKVGYAGKLSPTWDKTSYNFINMETGEVFRGTKIDFRDKTGLETGNMFNKGYANKFWFCLETADLMNMYYSVNEGRTNPNSDKTVYTFESLTGEVYVGTRTEFKKDKNIKPESLFCVNAALTHKGWFLQEKKEEILQSKNNFDKYTFRNIKTGEVMRTTRRNFVDLHPKVAIHHVFNRVSKVSHGWTVVEIVGEDDLRKSEEGRVGNNHHKSDKTVYTFMNKNTGEAFSGTRHDLKNKLNSNIDDLFRKSRPSKSVKGWYLVQENLQ